MQHVVSSAVEQPASTVLSRKPAAACLAWNQWASTELETLGEAISRVQKLQAQGSGLLGHLSLLPLSMIQV